MLACNRFPGEFLSEATAGAGFGQWLRAICNLLESAPKGIRVVGWDHGARIETAGSISQAFNVAHHNRRSAGHRLESYKSKALERRSRYYRYVGRSVDVDQLRIVDATKEPDARSYAEAVSETLEVPALGAIASDEKNSVGSGQKDLRPRLQ